MKSVFLLRDASKGFVLFALLLCKPVNMSFIYSLCLQGPQTVCRSWKIHARPQRGDKGKDKAFLDTQEGAHSREGPKVVCRKTSRSPRAAGVQSPRAGSIFLVRMETNPERWLCSLVFVSLSLSVKDELPF